VAELGEEVRRARAERQAIYPMGGSTHLSLGVPPTKPGIAIETTNLNQVIDYPSRDLTITVQTGIRVLELQRILAKEGQRLALDVPRADLATLGGALAVNSSGPRRFGCGTLRDYLIGVSFVNDEGNEIKSGGRVVKNVAGYDMCKLLVGSLGTLGIITQATLKLRPIPEAQALISVETDLEKIDELLALVHQSQTRPCCIELRNPCALGDFESEWQIMGFRWLLTIGYEDNEQSVDWQVRTLQGELSKSSFVPDEPILGQSCARYWQGMIENLEAMESATFREVFRIRASVHPEGVAKLVSVCAASEESLQIQGHAGNGIVRIQGHVDLGKDLFVELLNTLQKLTSEQGGNAVVEDCPSEWKTGLPIWGAPRNDYWLMHRIKESLDPDNIFNPGRFVDGI
jgi:glycolate oxidase FAD binding subunit